jgi:hypothetical protein
VSAWGSSHGLRDGFPNAPKGLVREVALTATLIVAVLLAAPARAEDPVASEPSPTTADSLSGYVNTVTSGQTSVDTTGGQSTQTTSQSNTATNTQTTTTTGGNGGTATGGNAGPTQSVGDGSQGTSRGGTAYANGGRGESDTILQNEQSSQTSGQAGSGAGHKGEGQSNPGDGDTFVIERAKRHRTGGAAIRTSTVRYPALFGLTTADRATALEAKERVVHEAAKASSLGGMRLHRSPVPGKNPFFNLLNGLGSVDAGLVLVLIAVLAASFALPRRSFKALRTRAVVWRPLAYVPPIELPG